MKEIFDNVSQAKAFEILVLSVLKQKCLAQGKPFYTEYQLLDRADFANKNNELRYVRNQVAHGIFMADGYAPEGVDDIKGPLIIEIKYNIGNMRFRPYEKNNFANVKLSILYIVGGEIPEEKLKDRIQGVGVYVWGKETISKWEKEYPIDYYSYNHDKIKKDENIAEKINFEDKVKNNKELLIQAVNEQSISISLGAGVSIDYGAKKWTDIIDAFYNEIQSDGKIDDIQAVKDKIGGTSIIDGQFAQDNLKDFMDSLYKGLYDKFNGSISSYADTTLSYVAKIIEKEKNAKRFYVITYNYDNFLEQELSSLSVGYNVVFSAEIPIKNELAIYHPHGYLPYGIPKAQYNNYKDYIVFSETEYFRLYNNPSSWPMVIQLNLYYENAFIFVGCSLTDPNLRRILDLTKAKGKTHFALMLIDSLSVKDRLIVHRHFIRMGVECIWFNNLIEYKNFLKQLAA